MGRLARGYTKGAAHVALQQAHKVADYDQALVERLFAASPLENADIRRTYAETYVLIKMQLEDLKARICDGTISNDEARTIPALAQRLYQLTTHLGLSGTKDTFSLTGPAAADDTDDEAD